MWSDEIDKKIKGTAEGHGPAYEEKDWDKMELLLNEHLPVEKKRRRLIIFWLLPLLLTGAGIILLTRQHTTNVSRQSTEVVPQPGETKQAQKEPNGIVAPSNTVADQEVKSSHSIPESEVLKTDNKDLPAQNDNAINKTAVNNKRTARAIQSTPGLKARGLAEAKTVTREKRNEALSSEKSHSENVPGIATAPLVVENGNAVGFIAADSLSKSEKLVAETQKIEDKASLSDTISPVSKSKKSKEPNSSRISLLLSAGPDISIVGIDNPGSWEFQYGVGASYALSKKLSVRTGFYAGHKIYSADSSEYHSNYLPSKLKKVDANCTVFEIPVNLIYTFPSIKKHNWFVSGGLSSYLMKEETYDYYYLNNWNQMQMYSHTYKSENTHIFSVVNLSAGYQYNFTDRFFIMAEPYARIPLSGIGNGKVKLNSAGILFSVGFKPFAKKN